MFQIEHFGNCVCLSLCYDPVRRNNCLVLPSEAAPPGPEHSPCLLRKQPEIFSLWKLSMLSTLDCHQIRFSTVWNVNIFTQLHNHMSCLWYCLFYGQIMIIGHSCSRKFNVFIFLFFSAFVFWLWSVFNVTMIFLRTIIVSIMRICWWSLKPISSFWETDPKSLFNRLLTHHLGRLLTQVQLQKLLKAHL